MSLADLNMLAVLPGRSEPCGNITACSSRDQHRLATQRHGVRRQRDRFFLSDFPVLAPDSDEHISVLNVVSLG